MKLKLSTAQLIACCLVMLFFVLPAITHAQPGFGDDTDDVPVDGGLSLLVAAGVGYGIRKIKDSRQANKTAL